MTPSQNVVPGEVRPDGTLELGEKLTLSPGPVRVTVQHVAPESPKEDTWAVLERIWAEQKAKGVKPRTREEVDADINAMRDEWEDRMREIERIHQEARRLREQPPC